MRRAAILAVLMGFLLTGCLGRFALTGGVKNFNLNLSDDKWMREVTFVGLIIIPVYPICAFVDAVFINTIEFWSEENPVNGERALTLTDAAAVLGPAQGPQVAASPDEASGGDEALPEKTTAGGQ